MRTALLPLLVTLWLGCGGNPAESTTPPPATDTVALATTYPDTTNFTIYPGRGLGLIGPDATPARLRELYGAQHVKEQFVYLTEGDYGPGVVVFPGTPAAVEIILKDDGSPVFARINTEGSPWRTDTGIGIGATLAELQAANRRPFQFYGFGWDYGGSVTDWRGGGLPGSFFVRLDGTEVGDNLLGEVLLLSDQPDLPIHHIRVVEIMQRLDQVGQ